MIEVLKVLGGCHHCFGYICWSFLYLYYHIAAIASISTGTPFGNCLTATQLLAGLCPANAFSKPSLTCGKFAISVMKTVHLTTFFKVAFGSAALIIASRFAIQASACLGSGRSVSRFPLVSAGSCPEMCRSEA